MLHLVIETGRHQGKKLVLPVTEVILGRDEVCKIRFTSSLISRRHCGLRRSGDGVWVRDLGSENGTYVNDVPIDSVTLLEPGDRLRVGGMVFRVAAEVHVPESVAPKEPVALKAVVAETAPPPQAQSADQQISTWLSDSDIPAQSDRDTAEIRVPPEIPSRLTNVHQTIPAQGYARAIPDAVAPTTLSGDPFAAKAAAAIAARWANRQV